MEQTKKIDKNLAREQLWRRGVLTFILRPEQKQLYELFYNNPAKIQTWLLSRRFGKTFVLCLLAIEKCIKDPRSIVKYVAPNKMQVERFIRPIVIDILNMGCPDDLKPEYNKKESIYFFPNGSEIQLCGADGGNIESVRGGLSHMSIIDEAQDVGALNYAIRSVLYPTTITTKGKVLIVGTPPQDSDHEFINEIERAEAEGTIVRKTVYENSSLTKMDLDDIIKEMGGVESEGFQREFLCKIIKSAERSVIPEATPEKLAEVTKEWTKPPFYHAYTAMDVGLSDWTVVLFGYYDFRADKIIIEDEIAAYSSNLYLPTLTRDIIEKEETLWYNHATHEAKKPRRRVSDHDLIVINEIKRHSHYKVIFDLADKKDKLASLNNLRVLLKAGKIIINPKCVTLLRHLKNVKWKSVTNKDTYARCPMGSHYDAVDALAYLLRSIDFKDNPYPKQSTDKWDQYALSGPLGPTTLPTYYNNNPKKIENENVYRTILNLKRK